MTRASDFSPLLVELERWHEAGKIAPFWLRDDDAVDPSPALDALLEATRLAGVALTLAVIPEKTGKALRDRLAAAPHVSVVLHGWSHVNHAAHGEKKQELGGHRPAIAILAELAAGFDRLTDLYADRFIPVLVPPWNRIDPGLIPMLSGIGLEALSVYGAEKPGPLRQINSHVDVMDWHGTRGGRRAEDLATEIARRLSVMFAYGGTMGLLTHHLVHDSAVRDFLDALFDVTVDHPACQWVGISDILRKRG